MTPARVLCCLTLVAFMHLTAGSPVSVFRPTGGSVTLEFQGHQQLERKRVDCIQWECGQKIIMKYSPLRDTVKVFTHKDRVEFNNETFSLELKNLQKNDSGLYRGKISTVETEVEAEYMLSVLDPVESPVLSVVSNWSSCDSCNVTVTCRGRDLSLTSTCNCSTCTPEEEHSTDSTLTLSVRGGKIICNHSNPVSWRNVTMEINQSCQLCSDTEQKVTAPGNWIWFILVVVAVCAGIALLIRRRLTAGVGQPQTEYAEVMIPLEASSEDKTLSAPRGPSNNGEGATYYWKTEGTTPAPGPLVTSVYSTAAYLS